MTAKLIRLTKNLGRSALFGSSRSVGTPRENRAIIFQRPIGTFIVRVGICGLISDRICWGHTSNYSIFVVYKEHPSRGSIHLGVDLSSACSYLY
jgi:hypothetical protein